MVIWVTEIQGDEFQHSFRKYEGLDSSLNSVPTMNVPLWMTYEWMTIPVICGSWTFLIILLRLHYSKIFYRTKAYMKKKNNFKITWYFFMTEEPKQMDNKDILILFYARERLVACLKITNFPAGTIFRPKYISLCLFPTIHTDVRSGSLYYNHFAFVSLTSTLWT